MAAPIRTVTLTREHFDKLGQNTLQNLAFEGVLTTEHGGEDVAISPLLDPMGLRVISLQIVSKPRNPIVSVHDVAPVINGKAVPPPPKPDPAKRVAISPEGGK